MKDKTCDIYKKRSSQENILSNFQKHLELRKINLDLFLQKYYSNLEKSNQKNNFLINYHPLEFAQEILSKSLNKEKKWDKKNKPLWGSLTFVKDNIVSDDLPTTAGSKLLINYYSPFDSTCCKLIKKAGGIILGKCNLDEFGLGEKGTNSYFKRVKNPINPSWEPGGSSSGSAVVVSTGLAHFSLGSDTGDSVRLPASNCGVIGFKPTLGSISRFGLLPLSPLLDSIGIFTNQIDCLKKVFKVLNKKDLKDNLTILNHQIKKKLKIKTRKSKFKIALVSLSNLKVDKRIKKNFNTFMEKDFFKANKEKIEIEKIKIPNKILRLIEIAYLTKVYPETLSNQANLTGLHFGKTEKLKKIDHTIRMNRKKYLTKKTRKRYLIGAFLIQQEEEEKFQIKNSYLLEKIKRWFNELFLKKKITAFVFPTSNPPLKVNGDKNFFKEKALSFLNKDKTEIKTLLKIANITGIPSLTIPFAYQKNTPFSLCINGFFFQENNIFKIGKMVEKTSNFKNHAYEKLWNKDWCRNSL